MHFNTNVIFLKLLCILNEISLELKNIIVSHQQFLYKKIKPQNNKIQFFKISPSNYWHIKTDIVLYICPCIKDQTDFSRYVFTVSHLFIRMIFLQIMFQDQRKLLLSSWTAIPMWKSNKNFITLKNLIRSYKNLARI